MGPHGAQLSRHAARHRRPAEGGLRRRCRHGDGALPARLFHAAVQRGGPLVGRTQVSGESAESGGRPAGDGARNRPYRSARTLGRRRHGGRDCPVGRHPDRPSARSSRDAAGALHAFLQRRQHRHARFARPDHACLGPDGAGLRLRRRLLRFRAGGGRRLCPRRAARPGGRRHQPGRSLGHPCRCPCHGDARPAGRRHRLAVGPRTALEPGPEFPLPPLVAPGAVPFRTRRLTTRCSTFTTAACARRNRPIIST